LIRFGRLILFVVAIGGFVSAHALVQTSNAMEAPVPTVTVPSLPLPTGTTPTVPSLPTPTVTLPPPTTAPPPVRLPPVVTSPPPVVTSPPPTRPAPAPRPPQPATTTTLTVGSPAPASRTATPPSRGYAYTTPSTSRSAGATRPTTRSRTFAATTHRTAHRVSVQLAFLLPKAERKFLIVQGPAPSCRVAGYIPVRGRKGVNTVYFAGRVHGRRLEPGVYLISVSPNRKLVRGAAKEYVRVVSPRRSLPLPDEAPKPSCSAAAALASEQPSRTVLAGAAPDEPTAHVAGVATPAPTGEENDDGAAGLPEAGVLGVSTSDADEKPFLAIAVLTLVAGLLLAMLALVTRFLRGSWNP